MRRLALSSLPESVGDAASSKWLTALAGVAAALLVVILADRLAVLTWMLVPMPDEETPAAVTASPSPVAAPSTGRDVYTGLGELHLFGEATQAPTAAPVIEEIPEEVPETRLQLTLRGIYHSDDTNQALAIIASPGGQEDIFHVGDSLPDNVLLEQIEPRRVVLSRNGRLEALTFPEQSSIGVSVPAPAQSRSQPARRINAKPLIGRYIGEAADNPEALLDIAQVEPVIEDGAFQGFRLSPGRRRSLLRRLGLRSGDVVTSINGTPLDNLPRALELVEGIAGASSMDVTVLRNGEAIPYTFTLN